MAKHGEAERPGRGRLDGRRLTVEIRDDGVGGADVGRRHRARPGLADRVSAVEGRLMLSSPPGGPTLLRAEIPCASTFPQDSHRRGRRAAARGAGQAAGPVRPPGGRPVESPTTCFAPSRPTARTPIFCYPNC